MSRDIKFRAWDKENNKMWFMGQEGEEAGECTDRGIWSFQSYFKQGCLEAMIIRSFCNGVGYEDEVVKLPIMQYTCLKDKNVKEIYEGDILSIKIYSGDKVIVEGKTVVEFKDGCFGVIWGHDKAFLSLNSFFKAKFEVIGNIYENPELLRGEK